MSDSLYFHRLALLTGEQTVQLLNSSRVFIFGLGGVGSWCAEGLVRSGVGSVVLVDFDTICPTNVNRQLQATSQAIGKKKADELACRLSLIYPACHIESRSECFSKKNAHFFDIRSDDYVIDAIDSLENKLDLIEYAYDKGARLFSSMGAARKLDPTKLRTADIWDTQGCPLARMVRQGLRRRGWNGHFTAVYSTEQALPVKTNTTEEAPINGSAVHVTATAGMILAGLVVQDAHSRSGTDLRLG